MSPREFKPLSRRRLLLAAATACIASVTWALAVTLHGRIVVWVGSWRLLSTRDAWRPLVVAGVCACVAWVLATADERRSFIASVRHARWVPSWLAPAVAVILSVAVTGAALVKGAPYAGGADAYGYVSQAELWAQGRLQAEMPDARSFGWAFAAETLAPLGYQPKAGGTIQAPLFPPGLPLAMAMFRLAGGREAVFLVVPLLGGLAIWATYLMGVRFGGRTVGAAGAVLLATSPAFLFHIMFPMSDVAATAWWTLALALVLFDGRGAAAAAGVAAGAAVLTRPNLVPLVVVPGLLLLVPALRDRCRGIAGHRVLLFAGGVLPACAAVALLNAYLFGSPLVSGQRLSNPPLALANLPANLARYPAWLLETETAVVLLACLAPFLAKGDGPAAVGRRSIATAWWAFMLLVLTSYLFFKPSDDWFWLRYLLPAFPPLFVLTSFAIARPLERVDRGPRLLLAGLIVGLLGWHGVRFAYEHGVFAFREGESRYRQAGEHIARAMPERAAFISLHHSGSIRYYSGRLTVRYDWISSTQLDVVIAELRRLGYRPYIALDEWEEPGFRRRFGDRTPLASLDWPPVASFGASSEVRIYDPADFGR